MTQWKYEEETKTIRTVPSNHWIASMNSWDQAVDTPANAHLIAAAPDLLAALKEVLRLLEKYGLKDYVYEILKTAIAKGTSQ